MHTLGASAFIHERRSLDILTAQTMDFLDARSPLTCSSRCSACGDVVGFLLAETKSNALVAPVLVRKMVSTTAERMSAEIPGVANTDNVQTEQTVFLKSIHRIIELSNQMGPCSGCPAEVTSVRWAR